MNLREGTTLQQGKYIIEKKLGQGGFGITYLAEQVDLKRKVAIKEFFMKDFCVRDEDTTGVQVSKGTGKETFDVYLKKFVKEARTIASLDNPHIIRIIETFEDNNTAYYVMDYLPGGSLAKRIPKDGLEDKIAEGYIRRLVEALEYLHGKDILHLDIKPDNILFKGETMVLVDFGLAKHYDKNTGGETSNTPQGVSKGYAPLEQYDMDGVKVFTPATDIYALGATFYHLLVGKRPPVASEVQKGLPPFQKSFPKRITDSIQKAMMPAKEDRPQSVAEFLEYLDREDVMEEEDTEVTLTPDQVDTGWKPENDNQKGMDFTKDKTELEENDEEVAAVELLINNKQYKEAYNLCMKSIKNQNNVSYANNKIKELLPVIQKQTKSDNRKQILITVVFYIVGLIFLFVLCYQMSQH